MSDATAIALPVLEAVSHWSGANAETIGALIVAVLLALLDGLKRTGPITKHAWLIDLIKLAVPAIGRAIVGWLTPKKGGGK